MRQFLLFLLLMPLVPAHADRDIVYSARYYAPPSSHRTSHFHLYRINPDGTGRTQLTYGNLDDYDPQWSPNGRWILFTRAFTADDGMTERDTLYVMPAAGGSGHKILDYVIILGATDRWSDWSGFQWSPDSHIISALHTQSQRMSASDSLCSSFSSVYLIDVRTQQRRRFAGADDFFWSPDGSYAILSGWSNPKILNLRTGQTTPIQGTLGDPVWLGDKIIVGNGEADAPVLRFIGTDGRDRKRLQIKMAHFRGASSLSAGDELNNPRGLFAIPNDTHTVLCYYDASNSTIRPDNLYFYFDTKTDDLRQFLEAQFVAWRPDGREFCIAPPRSLVPYARRKYILPWSDDKYREVWAAPLRAGRRGDARPRTITPGLVWVTGADWRKGQP